MSISTAAAPTQTVWLDVVDASDYQANLLKVTRQPLADGAEMRGPVRLVPEPANPYDPQAVLVTIAGLPVGRLTMSDARRYGPTIPLHGLAATGSIRGVGSDGFLTMRVLTSCAPSVSQPQVQQRKPWWKSEWAGLMLVIFVVAVTVAFAARELPAQQAQAWDSVADAAETAAAIAETRTVSTPTPRSLTPVLLSGNGDQATRIFWLLPGLTVAKAQHGGSGHFAIKLLDDQGNHLDLLVNTVGALNGATVFKVDGGRYMLNVSANGRWQVELTQPASMTGPYAPTELRGVGQQVATFTHRGGLARFTMRHVERGYFGVFMYRDDGEYIGLLANESAPFAGSSATNLLPGVYVLDVHADDAWSVKVE